MLDYKKNTNLDWEIIAQHNPYWGVLTHDKFLTERLTPAVKEEFFLSGKKQIDIIVEKFGQHTFDTVLDFGSGVGRLIVPMSKYAKNAIAIEISESMTKELGKNLRMYNISSVKIFKTIEDMLTDPETRSGVDWINSYIVFQHIPPNIGYEILEKLLRVLNIDGRISLHFNIFNIVKNGYPRMGVFQQIDSITLKALDIEMDRADGSMQMYNYDLNKIHYLLLKYGVTDYQCSSEVHGFAHTICILGKRQHYSCLTPLIDHKFLEQVDLWAQSILGLTGFSYAEEWGTWTDKPEATLDFILRNEFQSKQLGLILNIRAFLGNHARQVFTVFANNNLVAEHIIEHGEFSKYIIQIPPEITEAGSRLTIKLVISNPTSPAETKLGTDPRKLGLGISEMCLRLSQTS